MSTVPTARQDRRHARHEATVREILDAAWVIARAEGLAGLSLRALARAVGMEPQSLYTYFPSKNAIYDAMFAQANTELLRRMNAVADPDPLTNFVAHSRTFVQFCTEDPARYLLLFQRTIPGFAPSDASMALAEEVLAGAKADLDALGITDPDGLDLVVALANGLVSTQIANQPGGQRWTRLLDRTLGMFLQAVGGPNPS
jgi:AcrR family transcriptional regulator